MIFDKFSIPPQRFGHGLAHSATNDIRWNQNFLKKSNKVFKILIALYILYNLYIIWGFKLVDEDMLGTFGLFSNGFPNKKDWGLHAKIFSIVFMPFASIFLFYLYYLATVFCMTVITVVPAALLGSLDFFVWELFGKYDRIKPFSSIYAYCILFFFVLPMSFLWHFSTYGTALHYMFNESKNEDDEKAMNTFIENRLKSSGLDKAISDAQDRICNDSEIISRLKEINQSTDKLKKKINKTSIV